MIDEILKLDIKDLSSMDKICAKYKISIYEYFLELSLPVENKSLFRHNKTPQIDAYIEENRVQ